MNHHDDITPASPVGHNNFSEKHGHALDDSSTRSPASTAHSDLLHEALFPSDSYIGETYWADLPRKERIAWVNQQSNQEAKRELGVLWEMFKRDPFDPIRQYFRKYVMNGMGLFVEGYVLFSIGNLSALFKAAWPECFKTHAVCSENWIAAQSYLEILGIICGQMAVGYEGDWIGRKFGLCQDAAVMLVGSVLLTAIWGVTLQGWVIGYAWCLFIYGFGVGGEYPMTSTKALESGPTGPAGTRDDRLHRGRNVVGAFLMQGWGQVFNQAILLICLMIFHSGNTEPPFSPRSAQATYRVQFGVAVLIHIWLLYYRIYHVKDADKQLRAAKGRQNVSGYDTQSLRLLNSHYWHRLLATAGGWFANDVFFYGNKIFSSVFIGIIHPGASLVVTWEYNLLNTAVSLAGYYLAMILIDHKFYGRRRMQQIGFGMDFLIFLFGAIFFSKLQKPGAPIAWFQFMYQFSSFWNQFGPNCVSFLVAAEAYPASIRSTAHGFSAACGKLGALLPAVLYNYIDNQTKFWVVTWFGLLGMILTAVFLPDTTGLDLREQERYWRCVRSGHPELYHGIAIHPRHLSFFERVYLRRSQHYDPVQDKLDRIEELRVLYESHLIAREDATGASHEVDHAFITDDVATYFRNETPDKQRIQRQITKERALRGDGQDEKGAIHRSRLEESMGGRI
ncbi:hypothetical protein JCM10212_004865 [Sporobolomyces blumeae]